MRLTTFLMLGLSLQVSAIGLSQTITLSAKDAPLEAVFKEVKKQSGYLFSYNTSILKMTKPVTVSVKDYPFEDFIKLILSNQHLSYKLKGKSVIITSAPEVNKYLFDAVISPPIKVSGTVVGVNNQPLVGATIRLKEKNIVVTSDEGGHFELNAEIGNTLIVSYVGFRQSELKIVSDKSVIIIMSHIDNNMDTAEVVFNKGYYTESRRLSTGSVAKVTAEEISKHPVSNPLASLEGKVPGLFITQQNGLPGSNYTVQLRGTNSIQNGNSPLFIIDGVPFLGDREFLTQRSGIGASNPFITMNPSDIEDIQILKDADATAIYGSRGANGVVLITTKKGKAGKTKADVNYFTGWGKAPLKTRYLNTQQYLLARREAIKNDGAIPDEYNFPELFYWDTARYTDWRKLFIGGTARLQNVSFSLSGGNTNTRFLLGASYYKETTVYPSSMGNERPGINMNLLHNSANEKFNLSFTTSFTSDKSNLTGEHLALYSDLPPNMYNLIDSAGKLVWNENGYSAGNPLALLRRPYEVITKRLSGSLSASYEIARNFNIKINTGLNQVSADERSKFPIASQDPAYLPTGSSTFAANTTSIWNIEPQINYKSKAGANGKIDALVGSSWQETKNYRSAIDASGYINDNLLNSTIGAASIQTTTGSSLYHYQAILGRVGYNWADKYLVNFTGRRDGSSRFGPGKQFANFGALGLAWIFTEESLMHGWKFLNFGKLRGSFGITGNDLIGDYQYLDTYSATSYPYQGQPSLRPTRLLNPGYSWEQNKKLELAVELRAFKNRFSLDVNWYRNRSSNQIIRYNLPGQTGFVNILKNFPGEVENKGWEIEFSSTNIHNTNWEWRTDFSVSINKNKLLAFPNLSTSSYARDYIVGKPLNIFQGFHYLGVDQVTGMYQFEDRNKDNIFNEDDYYYIGTTDPKYFGNLINTLSFKGLDISVMLYFVKQLGRHPIYNDYKGIGSYGNVSDLVLQRWQKPGDIAPYQRYTQDFNNPAYYPAAYYITSSDAVLTNASYIRLRNVSMGYSIPAKLLQKINLSYCRIYIKGENLLTFTNYPGPDPETQNIQALPAIRMITAGIQVKL